MLSVSSLAMGSVGDLMGVSSRTSKGARKFSPEPLSLPQSAFMPANFQTAEATAATPSPMQTIIDSADASISAAIEADDALGAQGQGINYLFRLASEVAFNPELSEEDRQILETEFADVRDSIDQVGRETEFEGRALLDGSAEQSGHPSTRLPTIDSTAQGLNIANLSLEDGDQAFAALGNLLDASERIFDARDSLAVSVGRLDAMRENLSVQMDFSTTAAMQTLSSGSPGTTGSLGAANDAAMAMNGLLINLIA